MSEPTPEWMRMKNEIYATLGGVHHTISELQEWIMELEKRVEKLEDKRWGWHPPIHHQEFDYDE